jgi:hypothetical protein
MEKKKLIIEGYKGHRTMPLVSFFKQQAQIAKRDNFVEFTDFFNGCKVVVSDWKRSITSRCDRSIKTLNGSINYWQNLFIYDDGEWAKRVKKNGGIIDDYSLNRHHEEQKVDKVQKVKELEKEKEEWQYEKHCIEIYLDDYTLKYGEEKRNFFDNTPERQYITLKYNTLVEIENSIQQAEQELTPPDAATNTKTPQQITLPDNLLQALQQAGFIENAAAKPLKWIKSIRKTKGINPNKRALLDLLCLLEYPDNIIKDKKLLKSTFGIEFKPNHYTGINDSKGSLKRPIVSEYHSELERIVRES